MGPLSLIYCFRWEEKAKVSLKLWNGRKSNSAVRSFLQEDAKFSRLAFGVLAGFRGSRRYFLFPPRKMGLVPQTNHVFENPFFLFIVRLQSVGKVAPLSSI